MGKNFFPKPICMVPVGEKPFFRQSSHCSEILAINDFADSGSFKEPA